MFAGGSVISWLDADQPGKLNGNSALMINGRNSPYIYLERLGTLFSVRAWLRWQLYIETANLSFVFHGRIKVYVETS